MPTTTNRAWVLMIGDPWEGWRVIGVSHDEESAKGALGNARGKYGKGDGVREERWTNGRLTHVNGKPV